MKLIVVLAFICFCGRVVSQENSVFNHAMPGSESFTIEKKDSRNYIISNSKYRIILEGKWNCGEKITLLRKIWNDTLISIEWGPSYFFGIYHDYLFIDKGTGALRGLIIYDIKKETFIFSTSYECGPQVRNDSVFYQYPFKDQFELPEILPQCSEEVLKLKQIGYSEERIFILPMRQLIKTGNIKCEYRE